MKLNVSVIYATRHEGGDLMCRRGQQPLTHSRVLVVNGSVMVNRHRTIRVHTTQRGVALVAALFLIVVLAALGIVAMRVGNTQQQSVNLGLLGDRAVAAATTGIQYGLNRNAAGICPNIQWLDLKEGALDGFDVQVTCVAGPQTTITSTATSGVYGSPDYVFRSLKKCVPVAC
jgi:MSHA biogenesis protein MshP